LTATSVFWLMESIPVTQMVFTMNEFAKYPLTIYHAGIRILLTWIIPYGFVSFYPASYLLGRDVGLLAFLSPVVAGVTLLVSYRVWLFGLRHYSGTGS
jgi:ABC-2 type transport system permease protein